MFFWGGQQKDCSLAGMGGKAGGFAICSQLWKDGGIEGSCDSTQEKLNRRYFIPPTSRLLSW